MYADLKNVEFHTLLMQIMIKVQIKFWLLGFYLFIYFVTDFVDLSSALLFLPCAVLTPALQTSLCQIKSLRAASIPSTEFQFSLLVHERRAPGQSCGLPTTLPPPKSLSAGRQAEAAANPSWRPRSHCCCYYCWCGYCWASNEMLCQAVEKAFTYLLYHLDEQWPKITFLY